MGRPRVRAERSAGAVEATAVVGAPPAVVHACLTDPALLTRWWSPWVACTLTEVTLDARPGGVYAIRARTKYGTDRFVEGVFLDVSATTLRASWRTDETPGRPSQVTLRFAGEPRGSTRVRVKHDDFDGDEGERRRSEQAWDRILLNMRRGIPPLLREVG